jgi:hypothetical protein
VAGSLAALDPKEQEQAKQVASSIVDWWNAGEEFKAYEAFYDSGLTNEFQLGVWEILQPHSKIRNKLKAMHKEPKKAA